MRAPPIATANFGLPDDVKQAFVRVSAGKNKGAIITELRRQAIDEAERKVVLFTTDPSYSNKTAGSGRIRGLDIRATRFQRPDSA